MEGRVVRLVQGRGADPTIYADDPVDVAREWREAGADWLHVVDLDGAFGSPSTRNRDALKRIFAAVGIPVQLGGGLRSQADIQQAFDLGADRIVVGTMAVESPGLVGQLVELYGAERVAVAVDVRDGRVASRGWTERTGIGAHEFGAALGKLGVQVAVVTDISRDGMLTGVDTMPLASFARASGLNVIASGGVASLDDVRQVSRMRSLGVTGLVVGQALYRKLFTLQDALAAVADELMGTPSSAPGT
jgi:phosphoribosylformimino-5-aminoimidazole carboxamide ribotide isomerase